MFQFKVSLTGFSDAKKYFLRRCFKKFKTVLQVVSCFRSTCLNYMADYFKIITVRPHSAACDRWHSWLFLHEAEN